MEQLNVSKGQKGKCVTVQEEYSTIYEAFGFDETEELLPLDRDELLHSLIGGQRWFGAVTQLGQLGQVGRERSRYRAVIETWVKVDQLLR